MNIKENILAVPSKDRLRDESLKLLSDAGIQFDIPGKQLTVKASLPEGESFTLALMRPKDIVELVATGQLPLGIAGLDSVIESKFARSNPSAEPILELGIGKCRLVIAGRKDSKFQTPEDVKGAVKYGQITIATSYPNLTRGYFSNMRYKAGLGGDGWWEGLETYNLGGSVEIAPALGLADVISDLVETGQSLKDNGLREIMTIRESQAVLITRIFEEKNSFAEAIRDRLAAVIP